MAAAPVAAAATAAPAATTAAPAKVEAKEESEESDEDMGFGLFDWSPESSQLGQHYLWNEKIKAYFSYESLSFSFCAFEGYVSAVC